jgi:hypothetical protein
MHCNQATLRRCFQNTDIYGLCNLQFLCELTDRIEVVTTCITCFYIKKLRILVTQSICFVILSTNNNHFFLLIIGLCIVDC